MTETTLEKPLREWNVTYSFEQGTGTYQIFTEDLPNNTRKIQDFMKRKIPECKGLMITWWVEIK